MPNLPNPPRAKNPIRCEKPPYLRPGDRIALLSPSYTTPIEEIEKAAEVLRSWGFEPVIAPHAANTFMGKFAGSLEERLTDLRWALADTSIKAIICNRGGYGTIHMIDQLSLRDWSKQPKWLVGFSDITTLHGLLARAGIMSIHGTMGKFLAHGGNDLTSTLLRDLLMGYLPQYELPPHPLNIKGRASGILVGGNLCTLTPNIGTQADATAASDIILFLEEIDETTHNVDRQFKILEINGVLDRCKGVILGEFTGCNNEFSYESVEAMLLQYLEKYHIPVLCGFPAGHDIVNLPLIMGALVIMDVRSEGATLLFNIEGSQQQVNLFP